ncbi:MAG: hypothetical protein NW226_09745 [Microscillaceae bacterium]|nr:hypothetical protein [Microscillaceae bacterium]
MRKNSILVLPILFILLAIQPLTAQIYFQEIFRDIELRVDTALYSRSQHTLYANSRFQLYFYYPNQKTQAEIRLYPYSWVKMDSLELIDSPDFELLEDAVFINDAYYRLKVKFNDLMESEFLSFTFRLFYRNSPGGSSKEQIYELPLLPYTHTFAEIYPQSNELFIGEEKSFEIISNYPQNILTSSQWKKDDLYDHRIIRENNKIYLQLLAHRTGQIQVTVPIQTQQVFLNKAAKISRNLAPIVYDFRVKNARLIFLQSSLPEVVLNEPNRNQGVEMELNYYPGLLLNKTYRIENTENPGGSLKAEIFTRKLLNNGRVLCWLRVYNYHQRNEGYLYIKDGDLARFITNFEINPALQIDQVSILREGKDWTSNRQVSPGEKIQIKIEGTSLSKSNFRFEGLEHVQLDTVLRSDKVLLFNALVPMDIKTKTIALYNHAQATNFLFYVKEFEMPRELDFIQIHTTNEESFPFQDIGRQLVVHHSTKDIIIVFDENKIDSGDRLFGTQYLEIEIRVVDSRNQLLDTRQVRDIQVCPGANSPRYVFYPKNGCIGKNISLNEYLRVQVYNLYEWSTIELSIRHQSDKYQGEGFSKKIDIVLSKGNRFDLEVSFPGGLLIKKINEEGFSNFGGISMAIIAQFSFYHPKKINTLRPYKFGAGFLALNAFNFSESNENRDVGLVALGSLYPLQRFEKRKLSFPIYLGGGYLVSEEKWFYLLGPGIIVSL